MSKIKIAATGLDGLVGSRILELLTNKFDFTSIPQSILDITNRGDVKRILNDINFDFFLHLAAYTNVDGAETNRELCWQVNVTGTKNLLEQVISKKRKFI